MLAVKYLSHKSFNNVLEEVLNNIYIYLLLVYLCKFWGCNLMLWDITFNLYSLKQEGNMSTSSLLFFHELLQLEFASSSLVKKTEFRLCMREVGDLLLSSSAASSCLFIIAILYPSTSSTLFCFVCTTVVIETDVQTGKIFYTLSTDIIYLSICRSVVRYRQVS